MNSKETCNFEEACRALDVHFSGLRALDLFRVRQIADVLDVSLDWLPGRSYVMSAMEMPDD